MSHDAVLVDEVEVEGAAPSVLPVMAAGLFVWATILGAEADPLAMRWDALFLACTLLLIGCVARGVAGAPVVRTPGSSLARAVVALASAIQLYNVIAMWHARDARVFAAMSVCAGGAVLYRHLARLPDER